MSGMLSLGGATRFRQSANTRREFDRDVTVDEVRTMLEGLARAASLGLGRVCYVIGMGAQPKSKYLSLKCLRGVEVKFFRSLLPIYVRWLSPVVGSYEGVVKINDPLLLPSIFCELMDRSMAGVYIFGTSYEDAFLKCVCQSTMPRQYDFGVKHDPAYSFCIVDADNSESPSGMIEVISYGIDTPDDLIPRIATTARVGRAE